MNDQEDDLSDNMSPLKAKAETALAVVFFFFCFGMFFYAMFELGAINNVFDLLKTRL